MISKRLKTIASLIDKNSFVVDVGTDHAYLPIYLVKNNITDKVIATDISPNVIKTAIANIKKENLDDKIKTVVTDGINNIKDEFDTLVIAGMGTDTIIHILTGQILPKIVILQSNNHHYKLRKFMSILGYKIIKEEVILDKKYYVIIKYKKGIDKLKEEELIFGKSNNIDYYKYLKEKYLSLWNKSHNNEYKRYLEILDNIIEKRQDC